MNCHKVQANNEFYKGGITKIMKYKRSGIENRYKKRRQLVWIDNGLYKGVHVVLRIVYGTVKCRF